MNDYTDMIEFAFGTPASTHSDYPGLGYKALNIGDTRILGGDFSLAGQGTFFGMPTHILAGYTYIDPQFKNFDSLQQVLSTADYNVLKYRFRHTAKLDAETRFRKLAVGVSMQYFSFMEAIDKSFALFTPGITTFRTEHDQPNMIWDARIIYHINPKANLTLLCQNLLNKEYTISPAKIEAPRSFTLRFNYTFQKEEEKSVGFSLCKRTSWRGCACFSSFFIHRIRAEFAQSKILNFVLTFN